MNGTILSELGVSIAKKKMKFFLGKITRRRNARDLECYCYMGPHRHGDLGSSNGLQLKCISI